MPEPRPLIMSCTVVMSETSIVANPDIIVMKPITVPTIPMLSPRSLANHPASINSSIFSTRYFSVSSRSKNLLSLHVLYPHQADIWMNISKRRKLSFVWSCSHRTPTPPCVAKKAPKAVTAAIKSHHLRNSMCLTIFFSLSVVGLGNEGRVCYWKKAASDPFGLKLVNGPTFIQIKNLLLINRIK